MVRHRRRGCRPKSSHDALREPLVVELSQVTWTAPVTNDPVTITFKQHIGRAT